MRMWWRCRAESFDSPFLSACIAIPDTPYLLLYSVAVLLKSGVNLSESLAFLTLSTCDPIVEAVSRLPCFSFSFFHPRQILFARLRTHDGLPRAPFRTGRHCMDVQMAQGLKPFFTI